VSKPDNPQDSALAVTLTVDQLREIIQQEVQKATNGNGNHEVVQLLDAKAAAKRLSVHKSWISAMARKGELPCVHLGHYVRFKPEDLDQFIKDLKK